MKSVKSKRGKASKSHSSSAKDTQGNTHGILKNSLFGAAIGILSSFILILIGAFICYSAEDYAPLILPTALIAVYTSSFIGGFCASKKQKGYALLCGITAGAIMLSFWLICSFALKENADSSSELSKSFLARAAIIPSCVAGGYFGALKKQSKRRKH